MDLQMFSNSLSTSEAQVLYNILAQRLAKEEEENKNFTLDEEEVNLIKSGFYTSAIKHLLDRSDFGVYQCKLIVDTYRCAHNS